MPSCLNGPEPADVGAGDGREDGVAPGGLEVVVSSDRESRVGKLLDALGDTDWRVRRSAATSLAEEDPVVTSGPLLERLASEDAGERNAAIKALVRIGSSVVPALGVRLADPDPDVRNFAALALGLIRDRSASPLLVEALATEDDPNVAYMIVEALGRIGDPSTVPSLVEVFERDDCLRGPAIEALGATGCPEAVSALLELVGDDSVGGIAALALAKIGDHRAVPVVLHAAATTRGFASHVYLIALHRLLEAPTQSAAVLSAKLRAVLRPEQASALSEALAAALREDDVPEGALDVVGWLDDPDLLEPVLHALDDVALHAAGLRFVSRHLSALPVERRGVVASGLSAHGIQVLIEAATVSGCHDDVEWISGFLDDPNPVVAAAAARALGRLGDSGDAGLLVPLLTHGLREVAESACAALARLDPTAAERELRELGESASPHCRRAVALVLSASDLTALDGLGPLLASLAFDPDPGVRAAAAKGVCLACAEGGMEDGKALLTDPEPVVRRAAVLALGRRSDAVATRLLVRAASDEDGGIRAAAVEALSLGEHIGWDGVLHAALADPDPRVALAALSVVERTGDATLATSVERMLGDDDPEIRRAALTALARADSQEARAVAAGAAYDPDWRVREGALAVISALPSDDARTVALHALDDEDVTVRRAAVAVSGRLLGDAAMPRLVSLLDDAHVGTDAENALLQAACGDPDLVFEHLASVAPEQRRAMLRIAAASGYDPGLVRCAGSREADVRFYGLLGLAGASPEVLETIPQDVDDAPDRSTAEIALALRVAAARGRNRHG